MSSTTRVGSLAELDRELATSGPAPICWRADGGEGGATDRVLIGQRRQLDPPHAAGEPVEQLGRDRQREAGLADPARAGQRHEPFVEHGGTQVGELADPADERRELDRQVVAQASSERSGAELVRAGPGGPAATRARAGQVSSRWTPRSSSVDPVREPVGHDASGRLRHQHLAAVADARSRAQRMIVWPK